MIIDYGGWTLDDPTSIYMMSICKFTSIVFSYDDGGKEDKDIYNDHDKKYKIIKKPTFLEFCSFIYFYPTALVGPSLEFKDFMDFIDLKEAYANMSIIRNIKYGLFYFFYSFLYMIIYAIGTSIIPISYVANKEFGK